MRGKSHRCLGHYLVRHYMHDVSRLRRRLFLIGCIQPDRNPSTYLKGSIRHQWLRGHNFRNAQHYMARIAQRLEKKRYLTLLDYYVLGKLIHYTTDAFTYAHNEMFTVVLSDHMEYETALQDYFLAYMEDPMLPKCSPSLSIMDSIYGFHSEYCRLPPSIHTDSIFAHQVCCCVLSILFIRSVS